MQYRLLSVDPIDTEDQVIVMARCELRTAELAIREYYRDDRCTRLLVAEPIVNPRAPILSTPPGRILTVVSSLITYHYVSASQSTARFVQLPREELPGIRVGNFSAPRQTAGGIQWDLAKHVEYAFDGVEREGIFHIPWVLRAGDGELYRADCTIKALSGRLDDCVCFIARLRKRPKKRARQWPTRGRRETV